MEKLDTQKLRDALELMKEFGAVFLKCDELIIEFPRRDTEEKTGTTDAIGFEASGSVDTESIEDKNRRTMETIYKQNRAIGLPPYSAVFNGKPPQFSRPG